MRPATIKGGAPVRIERRIAASVAIGGSLLLALSAAAPAMASSGHSAGTARLNGLRFAAVANASSTTFAGWTFGAKKAKSVTTEFKVPKLKCTAKAAGVGPLAVTLSGSTSSASESGAGLLMACSGGSPAAAATVIVNNSETNDTTNAVAPGDLMKATVTVSATKTTATIADLTKGHTFTFKESGKGGSTFEEGIIDDSLVENGTTQIPVANFGKIAFSNAAISGKAIGLVKPQTAVNMVSKKKVLQILTGKITGTKKNAFLTTWKHS
jgi:Peptidase A4 family